MHEVTGNGKVLQGDVIECLASLDDESVDAVFADPPYFLQLNSSLRRPDDSEVDAVDDSWDRFGSFAEYDSFTTAWLRECRRVLRRNGTIWVIGTYHNIFRIGRALQDEGFWILNDIIWVKSNPMPNFRGRRFTNAHETLIWAKREKGTGQTFNYWGMKSLNEGLQMRSDWELPICSGRERVREEGTKAHSTQKPLALLYRVLLASTTAGSIILDPFLGSGTTAVAAETLGRKWIGIEKDRRYVRVALRRIREAVNSRQEHFDQSLLPIPSRRDAVRVPFGRLLECGMLRPGQSLYSSDRTHSATVNADGSVSITGFRGSIHEASARIMKRERANGWDYWFVEDGSTLLSIDALREEYRRRSAPGADAARKAGTARKANA